MYLLDTNICIYVLKNHSDKLRHKFNATPDLAISSVVYAELCYGIENSESQKNSTLATIGTVYPRFTNHRMGQTVL